MNKTVRGYILIGSIVLAALGASFYVVSHEEQKAYRVQSQASARPSISTNRPKVIEVEGGEASYLSDLSDDRNLVGASQYIFVGKVTGEVKTEGWYTQFAVQVLYNIKGNLQGTVNVGVTGGYRDGVFYVARGNAWLAPGSTYLLATRHNGVNDDGSYRLIRFDSPVSWKLLNEDSALATAQLQATAQNDPRVKQLEAAYPNERLDSADVYNHNDFNSYASLHPTPPPAPAPPPAPPPAPTSTTPVAPPPPPAPPAPATSTTPTTASSTGN